MTAPPTANDIEQWTDVKAPGDGRVYSVGSAHVAGTQAGSTFSDAAIAPPVPAWPTFAPSPGGVRQLGVLQVKSEDGLTVFFQRYVYGDTPGATIFGGGFSTFLRAVSVFPAPTPGATRIAVCGETFDRLLPLSQANRTSASGQQPSGFISVFDGNGTLQWTHFLFPRNDGSDASSVTDVSIRVEQRATGTFEVVTYCGISSEGVPGGTGSFPLDPVSPWFTYSLACAADAPFAATGSTNNGPNQWDGFVGRVERDQALGTNTVRFHAVLGGSQQDHLFGIAEWSPDVFCVVGSTDSTTPQVVFPSTTTCMSAAAGRHGVVAEFLFDGATNFLQLRHCDTVNVTGETVFRDVVTIRHPTESRFAVVGETDDPALPTTNAFQPSFGGGRDGVVGVYWFSTLPVPVPVRTHLSYLGGAGDDGLVGVSGWSEYQDHLYLLGSRGTSGSPGARDFTVDSIFIDSVPVTPTVPVGFASQALVRIRSATVGTAAADDMPAADGTAGGLRSVIDGTTSPTSANALGEFGGGGIAVNQRGRVFTVGSTSAPSSIPVVGTGRNHSGSGLDAAHVQLDMLPVGACRTDGTGACSPTFNPAAGFSGGTTPICGLSAFGVPIGGTGALVPRMMVDFEGTLALGSTNAAITLDRPAPYDALGSIMATVFQVGFPSTTPTLLSGAEVWTTGSATSSVIVLVPTNSSYRKPLGTLAPFTLPNVQMFTLQFLCLIQPLPASCSGAAGGEIAGSPALLFQY